MAYIHFIMIFGESNMKIVHWEYNEDLLGKEDSASPKMLAGLMKNNDTDITSGVWFRWTYLLEKGNDAFLHCVGEDKYKLHDIAGFTLQDLTMLVYKSFENFQRVFKERLDLINIE